VNEHIVSGQKLANRLPTFSDTFPEPKTENYTMPPSGKDKEDLLPVFIKTKDSSCTQCGQVMRAGTLATVIDHKARSPHCAGVADLIVLRSGFGELTRLASSYSKRKYAIVEWQPAYERWSRVGVLVETEAAARAGVQLQGKLQAILESRTSAENASFRVQQ
jgi:hypothetical protein